MQANDIVDTPANNTNNSRREKKEYHAIDHPKSDEYRQIISELLKIPVDNGWEITDIQDSLVNIHFTAEGEEEYRHLRGIIFDLNVNQVVCRSQPGIQKIIQNSIHENGLCTGTQKTITYQGKAYNSKDKPPVQLDMKNIAIAPAIDGIMVRIFYHNGKVYMSLHRRIIANDYIAVRNNNNSNGNKNNDDNKDDGHLTYDQLFKQLNGPKFEEMFDMNSKLYSPIVHMFIIAHPSRIYTTKQDIGPGYLVYLGYTEMYTEEECPYDVKDVDFKIGTFETSSTLPSVVHRSQVINLPKITVARANQYLKKGFYQNESKQWDNRLKNGEAVIVYQYNEQNELIKMYQIVSQAREWRRQLYANDYNILHRLCCFTDYAKSKLQPNGEYVCDEIKYKKRFPIMSKWNLKDVYARIEKKPIDEWPASNIYYSMSNWKDRFENIVICVLISGPKYRQLEVLDAYAEFQKRMKQLIDYLIAEESREELDTVRCSSYMISLIERARTATRAYVLHKGLTVNFFNKLIGKFIRDEVFNLSGVSKYAMSGYMLDILAEKKGTS
jgi:hypothetical protein